MQLFVAEFCGRWGCTWQENLISLVLVSFPGLLLFPLLIILVPIVILVEKIAEVLGFKKIETNNNEKVEVNNEVKEKDKTRKIINRAANQLAKSYLVQEKNNSQNSINTSNSTTGKAIAQTAKEFAKTCLEETSKTKEANPGNKSRLLGKTARLLAKKYLDENQQ